MSLHDALANQSSGDHPGALSLETVHAKVTRTRKSLSDLRVFIRETHQRHDQHTRAEQSADTSRIQHSADLQQVVTTHVAALHSALDTQAATISNIETGGRVVAEVVPNITVHFTIEDESGA